MNKSEIVSVIKSMNKLSKLLKKISKESTIIVNSKEIIAVPPDAMLKISDYVEREVNRLIGAIND